MISSLLLALTLGTANIQPILDPVSFDVAVITKADNTEVASLLAVRDSAIESDALSREQQPVWSDLAARIRSQYASANPQQRASLTSQVLTLQNASMARIDHSVWLRLVDGFIIHAERVNYPRSGIIWRITDVDSGQYLAIVRSGDASDLTKLIRELLLHPSSSDAASQTNDKARNLETEIEGLVEVNGQRQYLAKGTATPGALGAEMVALFGNLYGDGESRILDSLALLEALREGGIKVTNPGIRTGAILCAPPCDAAALPLPTLPKRLTLREVARRPSFLEPPEEKVVTQFFGKGSWPQPNLDREFKDQVRRLLSSSS